MVETEITSAILDMACSFKELKVKEAGPVNGIGPFYPSIQIYVWIKSKRNEKCV